MHSTQAGSRTGLYFDGQRWVPHDRARVRSAPRGPEVFDIGEDDGDEGPGPAGPAAAKWGLLGVRTKAATIALLALVGVALLACVQVGVLARRLPVTEGLQPERQGGGALAPSDTEASAELVRWHGLVPLCPQDRFVVSARPVILRATADKNSSEVARVPSGVAVRRVGPCENHAGLVRMPILVPVNATVTHLRMEAEEKDVQVQGWVTLTAEFLQGPRFFELPPK
mmetsp:Transcript_33392/g.105829  ORF Transcript_33392/g.105829 Transcript_33392/m.105829 type:complete len:226 (-) Transcript_33392:124-801(-)